MSNSEANYRPGTLALHAGQEPDPVDGRAGGADLQHHELRLSRHRPCGQSVRAEGIRLHLLAHHESDVRCAGEAHGGARRRRGGAGFRERAGGDQRGDSTIAHSGQNIISSTSLYGGTWTLFTQTLKKLGIEVRFFDPDRPEEISSLVDENTRLVFSNRSAIRRTTFRISTRFRASRMRTGCLC